MAAQTLSGTINVTIAVFEQVVGALFNWHVHIYATQGNSDTPRGAILTDYIEGAGVNVWSHTSTPFTQLNTAQNLAGLTLVDGDRIVIELGYTKRNTVTTSFFGQIYYGTCDPNLHTPQATDGTAGNTNATLAVGHIDFSVSLTESSTPIVKVSQAPIEVITGAQAGALVQLAQVVIEVVSQNITFPITPGGGGSVAPIFGGGGPLPGSVTNVIVGPARIFISPYGVATLPTTGFPPSAFQHIYGVPAVTGFTEVGYTTGPTTFTYKATKEEVFAPTSLIAVDVFPTDEMAQIEFTALEMVYSSLMSAFDNVGSTTDVTGDFIYGGNSTSILTPSTFSVFLSGSVSISVIQLMA